jgi:SAM-dependent methyltransferase
MEQLDRGRLRETFNEDAELYDRARPGYPAALFVDLAALSGVGPGCRVLEIGCGTGQATIPLAELGCEIICVELGANMAAVAKRKMAGFPSVQVVVSGFEDWPLPTEPFDVVFAATAFHWLDPTVRVVKAADALRMGGTLATVSTYHVAGGDTELFAEIQSCYERWDPTNTPFGLRLQPVTAIPSDSEELDRSGRFGPATFRRYEWELSYSTSAYIETLMTYSGHRALAPEARTNLLACIAHLIESRNSGRITKRYMTELRTARRRR